MPKPRPVWLLADRSLRNWLPRCCALQRRPERSRARCTRARQSLHLSLLAVALGRDPTGVWESGAVSTSGWRPQPSAHATLNFAETVPSHSETNSAGNWANWAQHATSAKGRQSPGSLHQGTRPTHRSRSSRQASETDPRHTRPHRQAHHLVHRSTDLEAGYTRLKRGKHHQGGTPDEHCARLKHDTRTRARPSRSPSDERVSVILTSSRDSQRRGSQGLINASGVTPARARLSRGASAGRAASHGPVRCVAAHARRLSVAAPRRP